MNFLLLLAVMCWAREEVARAENFQSKANATRGNELSKDGDKDNHDFLVALALVAFMEYVSWRNEA
jgi:hypothetical protein